MDTIKYTSEYENLKEQFTCGNIVIDNFLKNGSALDENQSITYVLLSENKDAIIGYYNIEVGRVDQIEDIDGSVIYKPINHYYLFVRINNPILSDTSGTILE